MKLEEFKIVKPKASDTMGIARDKMPQVKQDDYQEYKTYLKDNGVSLKPEVIDAKDLKPMQKEFSGQGVAKQLNRNKEKGEGMNPKPLLASSDGYIIDGHHRFEALKKLGYKVIPATAIDYFSKKIKTNHTEIISKEKIINSYII